MYRTVVQNKCYVVGLRWCILVQVPGALVPHELRHGKTRITKALEQRLLVGKAGLPPELKVVLDDLEFEAASTLYEVSADPQMVELLMRRYGP